LIQKLVGLAERVASFEVYAAAAAADEAFLWILL
jgi:hypothetical protein